MYRAEVLLRSVTILVSFAVSDVSGRQDIEFTRAFGCDFDTSMCGFVQDSNDNFNWMRNMGDTPSGGTGPSADHTTGNGYYMYIETSRPRQQGDNAKLNSPELQFSGNMCLKFYYHMYGVNIGTLNVSINGSDVFSASGDKGNKWLIATIDVNLSGKYAVTFEGIRGSASLGDIAVDDVSLEIGSCYSTFGCNFDTSMCGFTQDSNDNFNWTRNMGDTSTGGTGPSADHTTGNGYYMYIETSSPRRQGDNARLKSPRLQFIGSMCLKFYYHMHGVDIGTLKLNLNKTLTYWLKPNLFTASGDKGNKWLIATVDVDLLGKYSVTFEGIRGSNSQGDIAIDDFVLEPGSCSSETVCVQRTTAGQCCSIPFTYGGRTYHYCTSADYNKRWCSLDAVYKGKWGVCEGRQRFPCTDTNHFSYYLLGSIAYLIHGARYGYELSLVQQLRSAQWFFNHCDSDWNGLLEMRETFSCFRRWDSLLSGEFYPDCLYVLIKSCDNDGNPGLSRQEWFTCFKMEEGQWRWSPWTECSVTCGDGQQRRNGTCILPSTGQKLNRQMCEGDHNETRNCTNEECPEGQWRWSPWSDCSVTCGDGQQRRTGTCISPSTGQEVKRQLCAGDHNETRNCTKGECPGQWRWSPWSDCSVTCGDGQQRRTGTCISPSTGQKLKRQLCDGDHNETRNCTNGECPAKGKWSRWSPWTDCSRTCGKGGQRRSRICSDKVTGKALKNGWCAGKPQQEKSCADWKCPDGRKSICPKYKEGTLKGRVLSFRDTPLAGANISLAESPYLILNRSQDNGYFVVDAFCFEKEKPILISRHGYVPQIVEVTNSKSVLKVNMENAVHPSVTSHPEDRMRFVGQDVTFCCQVEGNPPPVIEWFRNENILDNYNNETLVLREVEKNMTGDFRCRAVNEFGAEFSEPATLEVLDPVVDTCNSTPTEHFVTLPDGCFEDGTNKNKINIGQCNSHPCLRNDTLFPESCDEAELCCQAGTESDTIVRCGRGEFKMTRVVNCQCDVCRKRSTAVKGIVVGGPDERPVEYCDILVNGTLVAFSDFDGTFEIPVPKSAKRLVATFRDYMEKYEESIVVLPFRKGMTTFHKIHLRPEVAPIEFDAEEGKAVPIASDEVAEVIIPANSLIDKDGNPKKGKAKVKIQFNDPRNERDILESPGDFTTLDEDGEEQLLRTYGIFKIKVQDENNQILGLTKNLNLNIDLEQLTGETFNESTPMPHLWWLDEKTGRWVDAGELIQNKELTTRPKRQLRSRAFSGEITPDNIRNAYNLDLSYDRCFAKVKAFRQNGAGEQNAKVTSIFVNPRGQAVQGYLIRTTNSNGHLCISTQCNSDGYLEVEKDGLPLLPNQIEVGRLPPQTGASIADNRRIKFIPGARLSNGPVYQRSQSGSCYSDSGRQSFFAFHSQDNRLAVFNQRYVPEPNFRRPYLRSSFRQRCFLKVLTTGTTRTLIKAESYSQDEQTKFGETTKLTEQVNNNPNLYATCLEHRCPERDPTLIRLTVLTGECQRSLVQDTLGRGRNSGLAPNVARILRPIGTSLSGTSFGIWEPRGNFNVQQFETSCRNSRIQIAGAAFTGFAVRFTCN